MKVLLFPLVCWFLPGVAQPLPAAHGAFFVDGAPPRCAVQGVAYSTPFDCTVARAKEWTRQSQVPASIQLGSGTYETRLGLQMTPEDRATIGISGRGKGEFGGGTILRLIAPLSTAVISYPYLDPTWNSGYWSNLRLDGFSIDANGNAPMCLDLYALRVAHLTDLSCTAAMGLRAWMRIGGYGEDIGGTVPKGKQGLAFQVIASDLFLYSATTGPGAVVKPVVRQGRIADYTIEDAGSYRQPTHALVFLKGETAGTPACDVMPIGLRGVLGPDPLHPGLRKLLRIAAETSGSGCKPNLHVAVPDLPPAAFGFELAATDSSFYDLTDDGVGTTAGIVDRGSDGSVFYHPHAWNVTDMFDAWGHDSLVDPEIDSVYAYGIRVRYGESTTITRPSFLYPPHAAFAAVGDFHFDAGSRNTRIVDPVCLSPNPNEGYAQLSGTSGPFIAGYGSGLDPSTSGVPAGLELRGNHDCARRTPLPSSLHVELGFGGTAVSGRQMSLSISNRGDVDATPFLLAVLPPAAPNEVAASLRAAVHLGTADELIGEDTYLVWNSEKGAAIRRTDRSGTDAARSPLRLYRRPDGSAALYAALPAHTAQALLLDMVQNDRTLLLPEPRQEVPIGHLVTELPASR